jgi:hypothetical protein
MMAGTTNPFKTKISSRPSICFWIRENAQRTNAPIKNDARKRPTILPREKILFLGFTNFYLFQAQIIAEVLTPQFSMSQAWQGNKKNRINVTILSQNLISAGKRAYFYLGERI